MHTDGVEIFHGTDGDDVAGGVAHRLKLDLLPAIDVFFHKDLGDGRGGQTPQGHIAQLLLVIGNAAAGAAEGEGGADDDGVADVGGDFQRGIHIVCDFGGDGRLTDGVHRLLEKTAVLRLVDGLYIGANETNAVGLEKARLFKLHGEGESGLAAEPGKQTVGLFLDDDPLKGADGERFEIDLVGKGPVGHDGGGV